MKEVKIERIDHQGRGIGYIDGKTTFIFNALPGEVVSVKIIEEKKKYQIAEVVEYITKSSDRVTPACKYYSKCGGCNIMHMDDVVFKNNKIKNIISRNTDIDVALIDDIVSIDELNYRNKITLRVGEKVGLYGRKTHNLVPIDKCMLVKPRINEIIERLNTFDLSGINSIVIRSTNGDMVIIDAIDINQEIIDNLGVDTLIQYNNGYKVIYGNGYITENVGDYKFKISAESFFQVNSKCAKVLYDKIYENVEPGSKVLDLYCGTGTIGIYVSNKAKEVIGIESNKYAIKDARFNAKSNKIDNISFISSTVEGIIGELESSDIVILDPPREGTDKKTIDNIKRLNPKKIIYISCDPLNLARDIKLFEDYKVVRISPFNMFGNTDHIESVCVLIKK